MRTFYELCSLDGLTGIVKHQKPKQNGMNGTRPRGSFGKQCLPEFER